MAATTLRLSNTYLGAQFRRLRTRLGAPVAIKAMAAKLARLVYRILRYGMEWTEEQPSTTRNTHAGRSAISSGKRANWDCKWSKLRRPDTLFRFRIAQAPQRMPRAPKESFWEEGSVLN